MYGGDSYGIDPCYSAQLDVSCAVDGQADTGMVPANRLDESRDGCDTTTDGIGSQFDVLDLRFLCALKAVDATVEDDASTSTPISTLDFEQIASDISLVDYAQELAFLPNLTELAPNKMDYTGYNMIHTEHTEAQRALLVILLQKH